MPIRNLFRAPLYLAGCLSLNAANATEQLAEPEIFTVTDAAAQERATEIEAAVPINALPEFELSLWASEDFVGDPVAIDMDDFGRAHVGATLRRRSSMFDIRGFAQWIDESWSWKTVDERIEFLHRELAPEKSAQNEWLKDFNQDGSHDWRDLTVEDEPVYLIEDTSGDGRANRVQKYLWGFNNEETDIISGILYHEGDVFVSVAPDVWRVQDTDSDGVPDTKTSISHGYGIHIGLGGHGVSGLKMGPDGRVYWAVGDIGFSGVDQEGKLWSYPKQGVLARSEPDGSGFEIYAVGLRNVHEFDWDEYGNLIGVDNDGDHAGEHERIVYLIEGSDTGWRNNWQLGKYRDPKNNAYKVWMDEDYYTPRFDEQAAHILPPIAPYHTGPAGMVYNPGTAFNDRWKNHFFVASFTGVAANSTIDAFILEPKGASFELANKEKVLSGVTSVGIDFGPDGALYLADWAEGWDTDGVGRIWKLDTPSELDSRIRQETKSRLATSFASLSARDLSKLLGHSDRRLRLKAQFELAKRGEAETFVSEMKAGNPQLSRIHAIWGLAQLGREEPQAVAPLVELLADADAEIRAQAAKMLGDVRFRPAAETLMALVSDPSPRTRLLAVEALGRLEHRPAFRSIVRMLEENEDADVYLRHAGAIALARLNDAAAISNLSEHPSRGVRIAAVVALKRLEHGGLAEFLDDKDEFIVTNAARAINDDAHVEEAIPKLAELLGRSPFKNEPLLRRAINAHLYSGRAEDAKRLALFALKESAANSMRIEAIQTLSVWPETSIYDRVSGWTHGKRSNNRSDAQAALALVLEPLLSDREIAVRTAAVEAVGALSLDSAADLLFALMQREPAAAVRTAALETLHTLDYAGIAEAVALALTDSAADVRQAALAIIPQLDLAPEATAQLLATALEKGAPSEKQVALKALGSMASERAHEILADQLSLLEAGRLEPEIQLDLLQAIGATGDAELQSRVQRYQASKPEGDALARYRESLRGGNAKRGREVFYNAPAAQCIRCHAVEGQGGDVGPDLTNIGEKLDRRRILESLVAPSAEIADGYGIVSITTTDGKTVTGVATAESDGSITIAVQGEEPKMVRKENIAKRVTAPSSMPPMGLLLSDSEIRDLVEFLANLRPEAGSTDEEAPLSTGGGHQ